MHIFADANALGQTGQAQWLYTIVFDSATLWGGAASSVKVSVDAWEPYLEAVS